MLRYCWHEWAVIVRMIGWFRCKRCHIHAACPVCLGLGHQGTPPDAAVVRYCERHLAGAD